MLHVENLRKSFGPVRALDGISFSVGKGEIDRAGGGQCTTGAKGVDNGNDEFPFGQWCH